MSQDLYRAYGRKFVYNKNDLFGINRNWRTLEDSEPDYLTYYDSDNGYFYEAVKIERDTLGNDLSEYQTRKLTYRYLYDSEEQPQDLLNGYNLPGKFDDIDKLYEVGLVLPFSRVFIVDDSDGVRMFRKRAEPGESKNDYDRYRANNEPIVNLTKAPVGYALDNQLNSFNFNLYTNKRIVVYGDEMIYHVRNFSITHGELDRRQCPILQVKDSDSDLVSVFTFPNATKIDSDNFYTSVRSLDSEYVILDFDDGIETDKFTVRYVTQAGDSEIKVSQDYWINPRDVTYPQTPLHQDSDIVEYISPITGAQTGFHIDHEPWKVFSDSDNEGYKASLGVQEAIIGIDKDSDMAGAKMLYLKKARFSNTPAVLAPNRPYNFRIQTYVPGRAPDWQIIHTELGFTGYTFEKVFGPDSEQPCTRVRFVFDACQPDFDPGVNALEVKSMKFEFEQRDRNIDKKYRSLFVTQADTKYSFQLLDSEVITGFFVGSGGGGGGSAYGAGGGGAASVRVDELTLPPGKYSITVGSGGVGGILSKTAVAPGGQGNSTILRDETNSRNIIEIFGATGGDSAQEDPPGSGTYVPPDFVGGIGTWTIDTTNYDIEVATFNGSFGSFLNGLDGTSIQHLTFNNATTVNVVSDVFGSGGAARNGYTGTIGTIATNAGRASSIASQRNAADNKGGGGGGGSHQLNAPGGNGGSGYAFITFK